MAERTVLKSKERRSRTEVSNFLRELADTFDQGELVFHHGDEQVALNPPDSLMLDLEIEEDRKDHGTEYEIEIELEWIERESDSERVRVE